MDDKETILIIGPSIVPRISSWGSSQRMYYLANDFVKYGKNVITISPKYKEAKECSDKEVLYTAFFLGEEVSNQAERKINKTDSVFCQLKIYSLLKKIKTELYLGRVAVDRFIYGEPSSFEGKRYKQWLTNNKNEILNIIDNYKAKQIIISGPSFSLFSIAKDIKFKSSNIKIIFDYRDPWYLWKCKKNIAYYKEKKYLKYADSIVCFSKVFKEDMCKVFRIRNEKAKVVYNGYSEEAWSKIVDKQKQDESLIITYTGSMDFNDNKLNYRNPNRIISAVEELPRGTVKLRFIGVSEENLREDSVNVEYIGKISQRESFTYMMESDVLLNIHDTDDYSGKYLISGKFYDYMRSGKVIWNVGEKDCLAAKFVKEYRLGVTCKNEVDSVKELLNQMLELKSQKKLNNLRNSVQSQIHQFSREAQNKIYIESIKEIK